MHHYQRRELSPVEVAETALRRMELLQTKVNAFVHTDPEATLTEAKTSEQRWMHGERPAS